MNALERRSKLRILLVGTTPPPVGGVSVHVQRLLDELIDRAIDVDLFDYKRLSLARGALKLVRCNLVHIHSSNGVFNLAIALSARLLGKRVVRTYHGEFGRGSRLHRVMDLVGLLLANATILLNRHSVRSIPRFLGDRTALLSAFIPPRKVRVLRSGHAEAIESLRARFRILFCTNAWRLTFDDQGREIYGISQLVMLFARLGEHALVISDPSGEYGDLLARNGQSIPANVTLLQGEHDFVDVIRRCDVLIRATTTDGDSLSIHEAAHSGKKVIASDCVDRPDGVLLYASDDNQDLAIKIAQIDSFATVPIPALNPVPEILCIYAGEACKVMA